MPGKRGQAKAMQSGKFQTQDGNLELKMEDSRNRERLYAGALTDCLPPRIAPQALQHVALKDSLRCVHSEQAHRGSADLRDRFNPSTVKPEMFRPAVTPWIKEPNNISRLRLD